MAIDAMFKRRCMNIKNNMSPFALKLKAFVNASRSAQAELQQCRMAA